MGIETRPKAPATIPRVRRQPPSPHTLGLLDLHGPHCQNLLRKHNKSNHLPRFRADNGSGNWISCVGKRESTRERVGRILPLTAALDSSSLGDRIRKLLLAMLSLSLDSSSFLHCSAQGMMASERARGWASGEGRARNGTTNLDSPARD